MIYNYSIPLKTLKYFDRCEDIENLPLNKIKYFAIINDENSFKAYFVYSWRIESCTNYACNYDITYKIYFDPRLPEKPDFLFYRFRKNNFGAEIPKEDVQNLIERDKILPPNNKPITSEVYQRTLRCCPVVLK